MIHLLTFVNSAADSEAEDSEEADGWGGGGDWASGTRQKEAAERTGRADRGQRAASRPTERIEEWDEVTTHFLPPSFYVWCLTSGFIHLFIFCLNRRKKKSPPLIKAVEDDAKDMDDFGSDWLTDWGITGLIILHINNSGVIS